MAAAFRGQIAQQRQQIETITRSNLSTRMREIEKIAQTNSEVDLAFLMDCTGSMAPHIDGIKNQISSTVRIIGESYNSKIRVAFVAYRDYEDKDRIMKLDFTENTKDVIEFLKDVRPTGGGDTCEDVLGGLEQVLTLDWKLSNRVLIHIADAPQHGSRFHDEPCSDSYSLYNDVDFRGLKAEDLIKGIKTKSISYTFGEINNSTKKMIKEFCKIAQDDKFVDVKDMADPSVISRQVIFSVSSVIEKTIFSTISTGGGKVQRENLTIVTGPPSYMKMEPVFWFEYEDFEEPTLELILSEQNISSPITDADAIQRANDPFAEGKLRYAFRAIRTSNKEKIVIKRFKEITGDSKHKYNPREECLLSMETQAVASFLAKEFSKLIPAGSPKISFLKSSMIEIKVKKASTFFNVEKELPGPIDKFTKWCSNYGSFMMLNEIDILNAFCHWTCYFTKGYLMVTDLQGVFHQGDYILTDPAINSTSLKFGRTDLGIPGMKNFIKQHKCSNLCLTLKLTSKFDECKSRWLPLNFSTEVPKIERLSIN